MYKLIILLLFISISLHSENNILNIDLDLEDLSSIEIDNTAATLTRTQQKEIPASITIITDKDILESGARTLDELLDIYVPSFAYMNKVHGSQLGFRGIISDRNNKVLLLVNNKVMNVKMSDGGAITERWFSMLGEIKKITIIQGAGSAIYGSGAIAGVISIETFSGKNKDGIHVSTKAGFQEKFYNLELSYGEKILDDLYMYIYYGADSYNGASNKNAANKFAFDIDGLHQNWHNPADSNFCYSTTKDNGSLEEQLRHKAYFQLDNDNFTVWTRFTKSSLASPSEQGLYRHTTSINQDKMQNTGSVNQQFTIYGEYRVNLSRDIDVKYDVSYMKSDVFINFYSNQFVSGDKSWGEDNYMGKVLLNYEIDNKNQLALGSEYNYNKFGRDSDIGDAPHSKVSGLDAGTKWDSDIVSIFGEYQTRVIDDLVVFVGARADKHKYSPWMYSPRIDLVYNITNKNNLKLGFNRSVRHSDEADMYIYNKNTNNLSDVEKIDIIELIYTNYTRNSKLNFSCFFNDHDIVSFNGTTKLTEYLGTVKSYGGELEFNYKYKKMELYLSHSYTKLSKFNLANQAIVIQNISASPKGYGNDFANWNNHITKIRLNYKLTPKIKWINSLRVFWGIPGAEDMANYNKSLNDPNTKYRLPYYDYGHTRAFEESVYLNSALIWNISKETIFSIHGYNILGLFNEDLNKRNFFQQTSHYRDMAPSFSIGLQHKF